MKAGSTSRTGASILPPWASGHEGLDIKAGAAKLKADRAGSRSRGRPLETRRLATGRDMRAPTKAAYSFSSFWGCCCCCGG
jgi:hypothetical protein